MAKKASILVLLLVLFLIDELMVQTEARICYSRSKKFRGRCFSTNQISNCRTICKREKFIAGRCSRGSCLCSKKCGLGVPPPPPPPAGDDDGSGEEGGGGGHDSGSGGKGGGGGGKGGGGGHDGGSGGKGRVGGHDGGGGSKGDEAISHH